MAFAPPTRVTGGGQAASSAPAAPRRSPRGVSPRDPAEPLAAALGAGSATSSRTALHQGGAAGGRGGRSPSPQRLNGSGSLISAASAAALAELGHENIVQLSQRCVEELEQRNRDKAALTKLLADLKKKKLQYDAKLAKKRREVDTTIVQTMEMEKKIQNLSSGNKTVGAEVSGLRAENERLSVDVEQLRTELVQAAATYETEAAEVERLRQLLYTYRKEVGAEAKQKDNVQQDLRATRTAQTLMINRLDDMEKRRGALKTCVAGAFNLP